MHYMQFCCCFYRGTLAVTRQSNNMISFFFADNRVPFSFRLNKMNTLGTGLKSILFRAEETGAVVRSLHLRQCNLFCIRKRNLSIGHIALLTAKNSCVK